MVGTARAAASANLTDRYPCVSIAGEAGTASESAVLEQLAETAAPQAGSGAVSADPSLCQLAVEVCGAAQALAGPAHAPGVAGANAADQPAVLGQPADGTASLRGTALARPALELAGGAAPPVEASPYLPALRGYRPCFGGGQLQKKARFAPVDVEGTAEGPHNCGHGFLRRGACSVHTSLVERWLSTRPQLLYGARAVSGSLIFCGSNVAKEDGAGGGAARAGHTSSAA